MASQQHILFRLCTCFFRSNRSRWCLHFKDERLAYRCEGFLENWYKSPTGWPVGFSIYASSRSFTSRLGVRCGPVSRSVVGYRSTIFALTSNSSFVSNVGIWRG